MRATLLAAALLTAPATGPQTYVVDPADSHVRVHVGRAGLLKLAGHEHEVVSTAIEGEVVAHPDDLGAARIQLRFPTSGLRVREEGEPAGDAPKVQAKMEGPDVLDVARFPVASFVSRRVESRGGPAGLALTVAGDFELRGVRQAIEVPVDVERQGDGFIATGTLVLRHRDFGMKPVSVAGVVKVKDEITVRFRIAARAPKAP